MHKKIILIPVLSIILTAFVLADNNLIGVNESGSAIINADYKLNGENYKAGILENSLVRLVVLPDFGGRVIEYSLKSNGHNQFEPSGGNPGLKDIIGENGESDYTKGNYFCQNVYQLKVLNAEKGVSFLASASTDYVKVERIMTLDPGSTRLNIKIKYTNIGSEIIEKFKIRVHPSINAGGNDTADDIIVVPEKEKIIRDAKENDYRPDCGWWLAFDKKEKETLLMTFDPSEMDDIYVYRPGNSYNMEYFGKPIDAKKGDSVSLNINYYILTEKGQVERLLKSGKINVADKETPRIINEINRLYDSK